MDDINNGEIYSTNNFEEVERGNDRREQRRDPIVEPSRPRRQEKKRPKIDWKSKKVRYSFLAGGIAFVILFVSLMCFFFVSVELNVTNAKKTVLTAISNTVNLETLTMSAEINEVSSEKSTNTSIVTSFKSNGDLYMKIDTKQDDENNSFSLTYFCEDDKTCYAEANYVDEGKKKADKTVNKYSDEEFLEKKESFISVIRKMILDGIPSLNYSQIAYKKGPKTTVVIDVDEKMNTTQNVKIVEVGVSGKILNSIKSIVEENGVITTSDVKISKRYKKYNLNRASYAGASKFESTYLGSYPQSRVVDSATISKLNGQFALTPTKTQDYGWTAYAYYQNNNSVNYMWYKDITYKNEKYRGVYLSSYRPTKVSDSTITSVSNSYQEANGYALNTVYWFKFEPIKWRIIHKEGGKSLLLSDKIIDSQCYCTIYNSTAFVHNGGTGYSNNYQLSDIRKWLNADFYNRAFDSNEKTSIKTMTINNTELSTGYTSNMYTCDNTYDAVFALSRAEVGLYLSGGDDGFASGTDYAKIQGLYVNEQTNTSKWGLRSPRGDSPIGIQGVNYMTNIYTLYEVNDTSIGVRPAIWI